MRLSFVGIALSTFVGISQPALAVSQVSTPRSLSAFDLGTRIDLSYNGFVAETLTDGLVARTIFRLDSVSANSRTWTFSYAVQNRFTAPVTAARVSIFGFDVDGYTASNQLVALSGAAATGVYGTVSRNGNVPQIGPTLDVCFRAGGGGGGCASGGGGGNSTAGSFIGGTFSLTFAGAVQRILLDNFFVRYQSIADANAQGQSGVGVVDLYAHTVPEPAVWAQLIAGFGLTGAVLRRRRRLAVA